MTRLAWAGLALTLAATPASAACRPRDLEGSWHWVITYVGLGEVESCDVSISRQGWITNGTCTSLAGVFQPPTRTLDPYYPLRISRDCVVTGIFDASWNVAAMLGRDRSVLIGTLDSLGLGGSATFTAVRQP